MKVQAIKCPNCNCVIYSRTRHDYRACDCGKCAIDGGFDYIRLVGNLNPIFLLEVDATKEELYDDWNTRADLYGRIKDE